MTDKELQKILNDKLNGLELKLPANDWEEMAAKLPQRRSATFFIWRCAAAAAIIALLTLTGIHIYNSNQPNNTTDKDLIARSKTQQNNPTLQGNTTQQVNTAQQTTTLPGLTTSDNAEQQTVNKTTATSNAQKVESICKATNQAQVSHTTYTAEANTTSKNISTSTSTSKSTNTNINTNTSANTNIAVTNNKSSSQFYSDFAKATTPVTDNIVNNNTTNNAINNSTTNNNSPSLTEEEAEQLLHQQNQTLLASIDQQNQQNQATKHRQDKETTVENLYNLDLIAGINANDRIGEQSYSEYAGIKHVGNNKTGPLYIRPQTESRLSCDIPFSFGLQVGIPITNRLSFHTGLKYTYLHSIQTNYTDSAHIASTFDYNIHYIGIPVKLSYKFINHRIFHVYADIGGAMDKGFQRRQIMLFDETSTQSFSTETQKSVVPGMQWSIFANAGAAINLYKGLQFYIEPGVTWFIPNNRNPQPPSTRTERPVFFTLNAGLRFNFPK